MRFPDKELGNRAMERVERLLLSCEIERYEDTPSVTLIDANNSIITNTSQDNEDLMISALLDGEVEVLHWHDLIDDIACTEIDSAMQSAWRASLGDRSDDVYRIGDVIYSMINGSEYEKRVQRLVDDSTASIITETAAEHLSLAVRRRYVMEKDDGFLGQLLKLYARGFFAAGYTGQWPAGKVAVLRII